MSKYQHIRLLVSVAIALCVVCCLLPSTSYAGEKYSSPQADKKSRVVVISLPRVSWETLDSAYTPNIDDLVDSGSIANLSIRVPGSEKTIEKGYATISAGSRNFAVASSQSTFFPPDEELEPRGHDLGIDRTTASDVFYMERKIRADEAAGVSLGFELTANNKANVLSSSRVGSFAQSLQENGKSIAVFGNADYCYLQESHCYNRSVGYLGVNEEGILRNGNISSLLNRYDNRTIYQSLTEETLDSLNKHDVTVAECSDLERIDAEFHNTTENISEKETKNALEKCDGFVGDVVDQLDLTSDQIFIISPMSKRSKEELTVFVAAGKGIENGLATSGITRREGIVALADIAPSILTFFEIEPPENMVNTLIDYQESSRSSKNRKHELMTVNEGAHARDDSFKTVSISFILLVFVCSALGIVSYRTKRYRMLAKLLLFLSMVMPTVSFLLLPFMIYLGSTPMISGAFLVLSGVLSVLCYVAGQRYGYKPVVLAIAALNIFMQCTDILLGGHFQLNSLFGYSAIVAGRFAGYGNLTFSIIAISAVIVMAVTKQLSLDGKFNQKKTNVLLTGFLGAILVFVGIPYLGSDVGGVLALTPTIFIAVLMLYEKKINIKSFVYASIATLVAITVFSIFDLSRPASQRTHLGRFVHVLINGDAGAVIERKIISNVTIFANAMVACVIIISTLFLLFLFLYPERFISHHRKKYPVFAFIAYPGVVVATLGMFLNDSGVAIPGMMLAIAFPALVLLAYEVDQQNQYDPTLVAKKG